MNDRATWAYILAIVGGAGLWVATARITGEREAWDASLYWTTAYPLAIVLAGALGFWAPVRAWRWGLAIMLAQAVALAASTFEFGLLPLGAIVFCVLAVPAIAVSQVMAWLRPRTRKS